MTTNVIVPYTDLEGDGSITVFTFEFPIVEHVDLLVLVNGVLMIQYSSYDIDNLTDVGGEVVFNEAPVDGARVLILRKTTISQNVDYEPDQPFPAETHEWNLDKITYILQELISGAWGGVDEDGNQVYLSFDLSVTAGVTTVTIHNSGGSDAELPQWVSGQTAGVFHGEIGTVPADESATTKPDGYVWIEHG